MRFDVITIFPGFFGGVLESGVLKRALAGGRVEIKIHDLRDHTDDPHRTVDDRPFGGGPGMVLKPEPIFRAVEALKAERSEETFPVILMSPQGRLFKQRVAEELTRHSRVAFICGRYEGVDERVTEHAATDELSIGDYVVSGGEVAAAVVMEAVTRLLPGVLGNEESLVSESFVAPAAPGEEEASGFDFPQYTRPADFRGWKVPEVLLSGDHKKIADWRREAAFHKLRWNRCDLLRGMHRDDTRLNSK